jgi:branched-chain amino acid transport system ATP-binding protein
MLEVKDIRASYVGVPVLSDISFHIDEGEIVAIVGSNGAGKSTILKTVSGLMHPDAGSITFQGQNIERRKPHEIVAMGLAHVPEGRRLFSGMNVWENLYLGAHVNKDEEGRLRSLERVFEIFPRLKERQSQRAGTLSGGERQMLAIARGLMSSPRLLMLDEVSMGLMPVLVEEIFEVISHLHEEGTTILLVEQRVHEALEMANRAYVLQTGRIVLEGTGKELLQSNLVRKAYLGM